MRLPFPLPYVLIKRSYSYESTKKTITMPYRISKRVQLSVHGTTSKIVPRSQSFNAARQMVGWNNPEWGINRNPKINIIQVLISSSNTPAHSETNRLARALFGNDLICGACDDLVNQYQWFCSALIEAPTDWLADYFGLPRDFQSTVSFKPRSATTF